jgi:hypothetical protein
MAIYDIAQPGIDALFPDSRFNPSLVYGTSASKGDGNYTDYAYQGTAGSNEFIGELFVPTHFSGKILLTAEDFALWTPTVRWQNAGFDQGRKPRAGEETERIPLRKARVVAIPWIQTNTPPSGDSFMRPSFSLSSAKVDEEMADFQKGLLSDLDDAYRRRGKGVHSLRNDMVSLLAAGPGTQYFMHYADSLFDPESRTVRRSSRKVFEAEGLSLFGYTQSSSNTIQGKPGTRLKDIDAFRNARAVRTSNDVDPDTRGHSSFCTPFVGKSLRTKGYLRWLEPEAHQG